MLLRDHRLDVPRHTLDPNPDHHHAPCPEVLPMNIDWDQLLVEYCPQDGAMGVHSESFQEGGSCIWCGAKKPEPEQEILKFVV